MVSWINEPVISTNFSSNAFRFAGPRCDFRETSPGPLGLSLYQHPSCVRLIPIFSYFKSPSPSMDRTTPPPRSCPPLTASLLFPVDPFFPPLIRLGKFLLLSQHIPLRLMFTRPHHCVQPNVLLFSRPGGGCSYANMKDWTPLPLIPPGP